MLRLTKTRALAACSRPLASKDIAFIVACSRRAALNSSGEDCTGGEVPEQELCGAREPEHPLLVGPAVVPIPQLLAGAGAFEHADAGHPPRGGGSRGG
eukprot:2138483-Rhodomonas_salina.2